MKDSVGLFKEASERMSLLADALSLFEMKVAELTDLSMRIRELGRGLGMSMDRSEPAKSSPEKLLSKRELEIFGYIQHGLGVQEIAKKLKLSRRTVETHRDNIRKKLHLETVYDLVRYATKEVNGHKRNGS